MKLKKVFLTVKTLPLFISELEEAKNGYLFDGTFTMFECYRIDYNTVYTALPTTTYDCILGGYRFEFENFEALKAVRAYIDQTLDIMPYETFRDLMENLNDNN